MTEARADSGAGVGVEGKIVEVEVEVGGGLPRMEIVGLEAAAMAEERERCRAAGMSDYLAKPFRREELITLIDHWIPVTLVP